MMNEEIGKRIKQRREELGISASDLADKLNFTKATIYRYESGDIKAIKLPVIEAIADILQVNPAWLIGKSPIKYIDRVTEPIAVKTPDARGALSDIIQLLLNVDDVEYNKEKMTPEERLSLIKNIESVIEIMDKRRKIPQQKQ